MGESVQDTTYRLNAATSGRVAFAAVLDTRCRIHDAPRGVPCWSLTAEHSDDDRAALCDRRIKATGFLGDVTLPERTSRPRTSARQEYMR